MDSSPTDQADGGVAGASAAERADALKARGDLCWQDGDHEGARADYQAAVDLLAGNVGEDLLLGRVLTSLGIVCDALGDGAAAAAHWERAIGCFESCDPPAPLRAAPLANNLGWIRQGMGDHDGAETFYLKALELFHGAYGFEHEETATVAGNLGALYRLSGHVAQECEMHRIAWEARCKLFGETHPESARSCHLLADAFLHAGDHPRARRQFKLAVEAYEKLGPDHAEAAQSVATALRAL